ncbi:MAG: protein phosphatase 2C domain-containing protein [Eubacteriales bacterium]|nr:protein phosphatase 2C domain-containing protein [Eubacteriales bacterium]
MIYIDTRKGLYHKISEDTVLVGDIILSDENNVLPVPKKGFVCVADGVGGNNGGADASAFVLKALLQSNAVENPDELKNKLIEIDSLLIEKGKANTSIATMATTLTGVFLSDVLNVIMHIGNTRAYVMQGSYLKQITQDHTVYNWLRSMGRYVEADACNKNQITNCFGGGDLSLLSKLYVMEIPRFNKLLLTSDGVHEYVDIDLLEEVLNDSIISNEMKCDRIINAAKEAGSEDDITVVLIQREEE